jgi:hypothetical protein
MWVIGDMARELSQFFNGRLSEQDEGPQLIRIGPYDTVLSRYSAHAIGTGTVLSLLSSERLVQSADLWPNALWPYIFMGTPIWAMLRAIFNKIIAIQHIYRDRLIFLVTDGRSADGDPSQFGPGLLRQTGSTLVCCLLSDHNLPFSRQLFDSELEGLQQWERELFRMNPRITTDSAALSYRVSHIRCSTVRHERGGAACPRREQGKASQL